MENKPFTSDLSAKDFWLVLDRGYEPLGLVLGNCIFSMGAVKGFMSNLKGMAQGELKDYSKLMYDARELAMKRMEAEAERLGADGVVAVKLNIEYMHNGEWMEVTAVGTAIKKIPGHDGTPSGKVFIS
ncbi:hypothetical protein Pan216_32110 [Planctomycetes bacterium Pan216]|uniref:Uncharacterized protein n=1 Tax=Kolteria novifilia TaxID=2527975 RepID=A0A518B5U7_9BACT|nr:hypothetical protein Pan216_32110 [Planctomycetes bacterium Pan216]